MVIYIHIYTYTYIYIYQGLNEDPNRPPIAHSSPHAVVAYAHVPFFFYQQAFQMAVYIYILYIRMYDYIFICINIYAYI
jgi:hypothetical protein